MIVGGALITLLGLTLVVAPGALDSSWPWRLTPLMSRVVGGWLLFIGAGGLLAAVEGRYTAYRYYIPQAVLWFLILLGASLVYFDDFNTDRIETWSYFAALVGVVVLLSALFLLLERRYKAHEFVRRTT